MGAGRPEKQRAGEIVDTAGGRFQRFVSNNRTSVWFAAVLVVVHVAFVCERCYDYRSSCVWVIVARASGQCLHFDCSLVLLLTLKKSVTWMRIVRADFLLPLDRHIYFHKIIGWVICVLSIVHTVAHVANFGYLSQVTGISLYRYLFDWRLGIGWVAGLANPSGFAILGLLVIMAVFSHRIVRKSGHFEVFYWTHLLCIPFYGLLVVHGPSVWKWILGPLCVFVMEIVVRIVRIFSSTGRTSLTAAALLPNQVVRLTVARPADFEFRCGDYVYVNIPSVAKHEWHPFTISSAPEEEFLTLHVRVAGGWTGRLHGIFSERLKSIRNAESVLTLHEEAHETKFSSLPWKPQKVNLAFENDFVSLQISPVDLEPVKRIRNEIANLDVPLYLDGPYGGPSTSVWRCKRVLLIAGGIGVTPFASLLRSLMYRYRSSLTKCLNCGYTSCSALPPTMKKLTHVDFLWVNRDLLSFQWFLELLLDLDREQTVAGSVLEQFLTIQLFQTGISQPCQLCPLLGNELAVISNTNQFEDEDLCRCKQLLEKVSHLIRHGRPNWDEVFEKVALKSQGTVSVFYCGPPALGRVLQAQCRRYGFAFRKEMF